VSTPARRYEWITQEVRDSAVAAVMSGVASGLTLNAACQTVARELQVHPNSVRNWVTGSRKWEEFEEEQNGRVAVERARNAALSTLTELLMKGRARG